VYSQARKLMCACICMTGHTVCLCECGAVVCYCYLEVDMDVHKRFWLLVL